MRTVSKNLRLMTRWFLMIGVLTGLCFSSGEGIQLLPFQANVENGTETSLKAENDKTKSYSYSVLNSATSGAPHSKQQKSFKFFERGGGISIVDGVKPIAFFYSARLVYSHRLIRFNSSFVAAEPSDRGPPLV